MGGGVSVGKKKRFSKNELVDKIRREFPHLHFSKAVMNNRGWDHTILILDHRYIFRFPKDVKYVPKIKVEISFLKKLKPRIDLQVPDYCFIAKDHSFGGYRLIKGNKFAPTAFQKLTENQRLKIAQQLGFFLSQLHNFPVTKAKKIGLKPDWPLSREKREYQKRRSTLFSVLNENEKQFVNRFAQSYFSMRVPSKRCVIQQDLTAEHIFIQNGKVNGIIDFGDTCLGDPARDFAWFWELGEKFAVQIYRYYHGPKDNKFLARSRYYNYAGYLSQIYHGVADKKKRLLKNGLKKIRELMRKKNF